MVAAGRSLVLRVQCGRLRYAWASAVHRPVRSCCREPAHRAGGGGGGGGGGGDQGRAKIGKFDAEKHWRQFLNTTAHLGTKSRIVAHERASTMNGGCCFLWACGWLLVFLGGFWLVAWMVALISWRVLGTNACQESERRHLEEWLRALKYRGIIWHTFVVPKSAIPNCTRP